MAHRRDRRNRTYTPEQIRKRAQAINKKKGKHRKKLTKTEMLNIALVILIIAALVTFSIMFGIIDPNKLK